MAFITHLLESIKDFLSGLFHQEQSIFTLPGQSTALPSSTKETDSLNRNSIKNVLDRLDMIHTHEKSKIGRHYGMRKDTLTALRKMGPLCIFGGYEAIKLGFKDATTVLEPESIPAISYFSWGLEASNDNEDVLNLDTYFILKHKHLPTYLRPIKGTVYEIGQSYISHGKRHWIGTYVVVKADGSCHLPKECVNSFKTIHSKNRATRGTVSVPVTERTHQLYVELLHDSRKGTETIEEAVKFIETRHFPRLLNLASSTGIYWKVSTRSLKEASRVTFLVEPRDTKHFFADREITVRTPTGQKKRILHYVSEHSRMYGEKETIIKAHLRGLREFRWNNYQCAITAPTFHSFTSETFTSAAFEEGEIKDNPMVTLDQVTTILAEVEDTQSTAGGLRPLL